MPNLPFQEILLDLDLGPLLVEIEELEPLDGADAYLSLIWEEDRVPFVAEFKNARDLRALQSAVRQARQWSNGSKRYPLVVVPYLNDDWMDYLRSEGMNAIDLSGNAWVRVPGWWSCFQRGFPNRFPDTRPTRAPYRGKSALVGRVLLSRPRFETVSEVQGEIERRGGSLSLGQVSKVLSALEQDLVVRKGENGVELIQPKRLLDSLARSYRPPKTLQEISLKANLDAELFTTLLEEAKRSGSRIAGYEPARHGIAPEPGQRLLVYVEPRGYSGVLDASGAQQSRRFPNLVIRAIKEPWIFFDTQQESGFAWCSPLETYLQLMQGGKREQEIALQFRDDILKKDSAAR